MITSRQPEPFQEPLAQNRPGQRLALRMLPVPTGARTQGKDRRIHFRNARAGRALPRSRRRVQRRRVGENQAFPNRRVLSLEDYALPSLYRFRVAEAENDVVREKACKGLGIAGINGGEKRLHRMRRVRRFRQDW